MKPIVIAVFAIFALSTVSTFAHDATVKSNTSSNMDKKNEDTVETKTVTDPNVDAAHR